MYNYALKKIKNKIPIGELKRAEKIFFYNLFDWAIVFYHIITNIGSWPHTMRVQYHYALTNKVAFFVKYLLFVRGLDKITAQTRSKLCELEITMF